MSAPGYPATAATRPSMPALTAPDGSVPPVRDVIYVVTDPGVPAYGRKGCSVHVQSVLRELTTRATAAGGTVTLIATRLGGEAPAGLEDVRTIELGRPGAGDPAEAEVALQGLDARAADLVAEVLDTLASSPEYRRGVDVPAPLVYQRYGLWSAEVMERAGAQGARTVLEINAPLVEEQERHRVLVDRTTALEMTGRAVRAAHLPYAVSTAVSFWAAAVAGLRTEAVPTIPNGVDVARFAAQPGSGADVPVIGFVSTFRPWHAPELLIDAAAALVAEGLPVRLLLVGDGPTLVDNCASAVAAGVEFESTGAVDPAEVPELLARCDVAAAPYPAGDAYFSPLKVAEYLAAGLPTVAAAVADLPHLFGRDEVALVTPGDVVALTDALRRVLTDPAHRAALAAGGRRAARERFAWSAVVDRVLVGACVDSSSREGLCA